MDRVVGHIVNRAADLPEGMVGVEVPAARYAVLDCTLPAIGATYGQIHPWLAQSAYQHAGTPEFEYYGPDFDPEDADSVMSVYIPVK